MLRTASDISALTPEQLRELVASLQKDVVSREKHVTALEQNVALLEKEVKAEHEKRCKAECDLWAQREAVKENLPALKAAMREFSREAGPYGDLLSMSIYEQVSFLCSELIRLARDAAMYRHEHYGHGPDMPGTKGAVREVTPDDVRSVFKGTRNTMQSMARQFQALTRAAGRLDDADPVRIGLEHAASLRAVNKPNTERKNLGRRPNPPKKPPKRQETVPAESLPCTGRDPKTGKVCRGKLKPISEIVAKLKTKHTRMADQIEFLETHNQIYYCEACGEVFIPTADNQEVPIVPNREIGHKLLVECALGVCSGTPISRASAEFQDACSLGSDTIQRNFNDFGQIYLKPLMLALKEELKTRPTVVADESTLDVLELQGRGHQSAKTHEAAEPISGNYFLALTTPAQTDYPVACYEYMGSSSLKRLREMLGDTFRCEALAADGYAAYDSLIAQGFGLNGKAVRQSCLTHLRRRLCQAIGAEALNQQAEAFADEELASINLESLKAGDPDRELMAAVVILGAVYAVEQRCAREPHETEADWLVRLAKARKEKSTVLMDDLDRIMLKLSSGRIEPTSNAKSWRSIRKSDPYAAACIYYMNGRQKFRTFLSDPRIPPSTDIVEGRIRPVTVLRKNIYFMQTLRGAEAMMAAYSLVQTGKLNGMDVRTWLSDFVAAAYMHCVRKAWRYALQEGKDPTRKIMDYNVSPLAEVKAAAQADPDDDMARTRLAYNMHHLIEDFDFTAWLPRNCAERYQNECEVDFHDVACDIVQIGE